jgi:NAD(P)-dependent dehydrogenase (short-subunit alcohol dehydrogenase family)
MDLGLSGKACAVTGASRGIGRDVARRLCAEGAAVLLVARTADELEAAAQECRRDGEAAGGRAEALALDVTAADAGERMVAAAQEHFGALDALVNNAGTARWRPLEDVPDADWKTAFELNVMAPLRAMRAAIPGMRERGWGRIVNVASTAGKRPSAMMPEYSVAKAAELSLSRLVADLYARDGVIVNAVCPGPTKSEMWMDPGGLLDQSQAAGGQDSREQALEAAGARRPIGRLAEVGEIAATIVFLCSEHASYVAGAAWSVDGGTVQVII